ncbi:hypothetical protein [Streptomyces sp. NPDC048057]|uniref:hypothetical protein n=1 Tax=Streptomyces sp. NPDC048057 TaxID=3155628 RepID=UPI003408129F
MTAQPGHSRNTGQPPDINFTVSHVGLGTPQLGNFRQEGTLSEINFAMKRVVSIAMSAVGGPTDLQQVKDFFAWPTLQAPGVPPTSNDWAAMFNTKTKAFVGLAGVTDTGETRAIVCAHAIRFTDPMWEMVQESGCVLLCTGLSGDPTAAEFGAAAGNRKPQAVLAQAVCN